MGKSTWKKLFVDEPRIWNMQQPTDDSVRSMLGDVARSTFFVYFWDYAKTKSLLNISESSKDLSVISIKEKKIITLEN